MTIPLSHIVPREQLLSRGAGFLYGVYPVFNLQIKGGGRANRPSLTSHGRKLKSLPDMPC